MQDVLNRLASRDNSAPDDNIVDGIRVCPVCGKPKQTRLILDGLTRLVSVRCECEEKAAEKERERHEKENFILLMQERWRRYGVMDPAFMRDMTFAADDRRDAKTSAVCQLYVEQWPEMCKNNIGVLFYGPVGTGKSFLANAIANALLDMKISVAVTNFPRLLNLLQRAENRQNLIDHLQEYDLLVIDDLGAERNSAYASEQVFSVVNAREHAKRPLIVTTNLTLDELENPQEIQNLRIYDRILEMCPIKLKMTGESRRISNGKRRAEIALSILQSRSGDMQR